MNGWPDASFPTETISANKEVGKDRCRVIAENWDAVNQEMDLTISDFEGSFSSGDWAMMIQMHGIGLGKYTLVVIQNSVSSPSTAVSVKPYNGGGYTNAYHSWSYIDPEDRVQLVKISAYWNLTLSGGIVHCPKYDHAKGTGGIVPIMVGNNFTMTGGYISAAGAGFHATILAGGSIGQGSPAASAATSHIPGGSLIGGLSGAVNSSLYGFNYSAFPDNTPGWYGIPNGPLCLSNPGVYTMYKCSDQGQDGGLANNAVPTPSNLFTSGVITYVFTHSNYSANDLHLGCSGGHAGDLAAFGGGGGGYGGKGGDFGNPVSGNPAHLGELGDPGEDGEPGENAGMPGVGGGIIYLKVANSSLSFSDSRKRFYANATNGENGGNGGDGGIGGKGDRGSAGDCDGAELMTPGGWGAGGDGGKGGDGGDAGDGGCGGTVWILKKNGGTHSTFSSYVTNQTGFGGTGGYPGHKFTHLNVPNARHYTSDLSTLSCNASGDFVLCNPNKACEPVKCDCDEVFRHLGQDMGSGLTINNTITPWSIDKTGQESVNWHGNAELSYTKTVNGCATKYVCTMSDPSLFSEMMEKAFKVRNLQTYVGTPINPGIDEAAYIPGNKTQLSIAGHLVLEYDPSYTPKRLTDFDDPKNTYVNDVPCFENFKKIEIPPLNPPVGGGGGGGGNSEEPDEDEILVRGTYNGVQGENGSGQAGGAFYEDDEVGAPGGNNGNGQGNDKLGEHSDIFTLQVLPEGKVQINTADSEIGIYTLYTLDGKLLSTKESADTQVLLTGLSSGIYILNVQKMGKQYNRKVYIP